MALGEILIKRISRASAPKNGINENFPSLRRKSGAFTIFVRLFGKYVKNNNKKNDIFQLVIKPNHQSEAFFVTMAIVRMFRGKSIANLRYCESILLLGWWKKNVDAPKFIF